MGKVKLRRQEPTASSFSAQQLYGVKVKHGVLAFIILILSLGAIVLFNVDLRLQHPPNKTKIKGAKTILIGDEIEPRNPLKNSPFDHLGVYKKITVDSNKDVALINHAVYSGLGIALTDQRNKFISWLPEANLKYIGGGELEYAGETFDWWVFDNLDNDMNKELAIQLGIIGTAGVSPFYLYSYEENKFKLLLRLFESSSKTEIKDLDEDGVKEIIHDYSIFGIGKLERDLLRWKDIWRLEDGRPVKVNHQFPEEYQELIDLHQLALTKKEWEPDAQSYYPVLRCLKEEAELTTQGRPVDIEECRELLKKRYE